MSMDAQLQELLDKQALFELVYRYARAVDRNDGELLLSCYHPDAYQHQGYYEGGPEGLLAALQAYVMTANVPGPLQHSMSNAVFEVKGDVAYGESYCQMRMVAASGEINLGMCRYVDRFERRDGVWKIIHRRTIMEQRRPGLKPAPFLKGSRDRSDPSYERD
jgi:ketosteroid isomerase-like protein